MILINEKADYSALGLGKMFAPATNETNTMIGRYSKGTKEQSEALALFFEEIGATIKNKLVALILPIFSSNWEEALINALTGEKIQSGDVREGQSYYLNMKFSNTYKALGCSGNISLYINFQIPANIYELGIAAIVSSTYPFIMQYGKVYVRNDNFGINYKKFVGILYTNATAGGTVLSKFGDEAEYTGYSQEITTTSGTEYSMWFGSSSSDNPLYNYHDGDGVRILAAGVGLTADEMKTLRAAVLHLDSQYFNDNAFPIRV